MAFQAFQHLYKTGPLAAEGAREGGAGGGLLSPCSCPPHPPACGDPLGPAPSAGWRGDAASGWAGRPGHPETLSTLQESGPGASPCSSLSLSLLASKMGRAETVTPTPTPPSCWQDPTGRSRKSAWHRALHMASAE